MRKYNNLFFILIYLHHICFVFYEIFQKWYKRNSSIFHFGIFNIRIYICSLKIKRKWTRPYIHIYITKWLVACEASVNWGGVTQAQLAEFLKVNQAFISKVETCERRLDIIELHHICQVLNISFVDFIAEVDRDILRKNEGEALK